MTGVRSAARWTFVVSSLVTILVVRPRAGAESCPGSLCPEPPEIIYASGSAGSTEKKIFVFQSTDPGTILRTLNVTGLDSTETLVGIDFRPGTKTLYGIAASRQVECDPACATSLVIIDKETGEATPVGGGGTLEGMVLDEYGMDFDPVFDVLRVVTSGGKRNFVVDPDTGALHENSVLPDSVTADLLTRISHRPGPLSYGSGGVVVRNAG